MGTASASASWWATAPSRARGRARRARRPMLGGLWQTARRPEQRSASALMQDLIGKNNLSQSQAALLRAVPPHGRIEVRNTSTQLRELLRGLQDVANANGYKAKMGNSQQVPGEIANLERLGTPADGERIETVCEIGFNAGHSAAALLMHNRATLHEFDVMSLRWSAACLDEIRRLFPGRVQLHKGDSKRTGPAFAQRVKRGEQKPCDVFFVDGMHNNPWVLVDLITAIASTRPGGKIMVDDATALWKTVIKMWHLHTSSGDIVRPRCALPTYASGEDGQPSSGGLAWLRGFCEGERPPASHPFSVNWFREESATSPKGQRVQFLTDYPVRAAWRWHVSRLKEAAVVY